MILWKNCYRYIYNDFDDYFNEHKRKWDQNHWRSMRYVIDIAEPILQKSLEARGFYLINGSWIKRGYDRIISHVIVVSIERQHSRNPSCLIKDILTRIDMGQSYSLEYSYDRGYELTK